MAKKISHKIKRLKSAKGRSAFGRKKTLGHYFKLSILSVVSCLVVFTIGNFMIKPQVPCANSKTCKSDLTQQIDNNAKGTFEGHTIVPPKIDLANALPNTVLGAATGDKHIYVDLSKQKLYAYQGTTKFLETFISSGKWNPTPVGNFHIWEKLVATRMAGGSGDDAYDLPNVPYVMYFYQDFGLHGAYWHNNFGHMMSHGCVNERFVDAKALYEWADGPSGDTPGTAVSICNSFSEPNTCVQTNPIND